MLEMKTIKEENQESHEAATAQKTEVAPAVEAVSDDGFPSELREPRWSLVSFETCLAANLTYDEAAVLMKDFTAKKTSGLCIITDTAAARIERN